MKKHDKQSKPTKNDLKQLLVTNYCQEVEMGRFLFKTVYRVDHGITFFFLELTSVRKGATVSCPLYKSKISFNKRKLVEAPDSALRRIAVENVWQNSMS